MAARPRVLLVDDDARVLSSLRRTLRREPFEVEIAENGIRALERLAEEPLIDLVISDQKMPGLTGTQFLAKVRAQWPKTRRILLSGWTSEIPKAEIEAAGLSAVLGKPWDDAELKDSIHAALGLD